MLKDYQYLGDGVYASFDGYHIRLHLGSHTNPPEVAIEGAVMEALVLYAQKHGLLPKVQA